MNKCYFCDKEGKLCRLCQKYFCDDCRNKHKERIIAFIKEKFPSFILKSNWRDFW